MSRRRHILSVLLVGVLLQLTACDNGLAPPPAVQPGFGGTVSFVPGTWPSSDSLAQISLWVAASQLFPLDSAAIFQGLLSSPPRIYLYPSLQASMPKDKDTVAYAFSIPPASYKYICVLQYFGSNLTISSFKVVGLYHQAADSTLPQVIDLAPGQFVPNVNITVDFHHPPPQPF